MAPSTQPSSKIRKFTHTFTSTPSTPSASTLSPSLQTSLLQLGMRIRKSVAQGYRTQWAIEEEKIRACAPGNLYRRASQQEREFEILPDADVAHDANNDDDGLPAWMISSSQESTNSTASTASTASSAPSTMGVLNIASQPLPKVLRKRTLNTDHDEDDDGSAYMQATSTHHLRPIAQARSRRRVAAGPGGRGAGEGKKSAAVTTVAMENWDFEEVRFLDERNWIPSEAEEVEEL